MSNNEQSRIDRLEALAEQILQRTDSNAKSIEALTNAIAGERKERQRSERRLYESMAQMSEALAQMSGALAQIGSAQASFWEIQADYYRRLEEMDEWQATMLEILNRLTQKDSNS